MHRTMTRRFYSSSTAVKRPQLLQLYIEAMNQAKDYLTNHPDEDEVYILEIVKVVKRKEVITPHLMPDEVEIIELG